MSESPELSDRFANSHGLRTDKNLFLDKIKLSVTSFPALTRLASNMSSSMWRFYRTWKSLVFFFPLKDLIPGYGYHGRPIKDNELHVADEGLVLEHACWGSCNECSLRWGVTLRIRLGHSPPRNFSLSTTERTKTGCHSNNERKHYRVDWSEKDKIDTEGDCTVNIVGQTRMAVGNLGNIAVNSIMRMKKGPL